ncbi:guanylate kinase [Peziza echinospora]|nr:guanylate kinase [Peziza echinospora]
MASHLLKKSGSTALSALSKSTILSAKQAAQLDVELMSESEGGFTLEQLMELAGLSVSQVMWRVFPLQEKKEDEGRRVLVVCGPGNNGGDGLVLARHLHHFGYTPTIHYPKPGKHPHYTRLLTQLRQLNVGFTSPATTETFKKALGETDHVVDAIFGFSFKGEVREPFREVIGLIGERQRESGGRVKVTSVDVPSGWDVEEGPPREGEKTWFMPDVLVSLTAPKPCSKFLKRGEGAGRVGVGVGPRHFLGGRFVGGERAEKFGLRFVKGGWVGDDQIVELEVE